jgi:hypothetical protein
LVDYDLALLLQPLALGGTTIGVILNQIFPDWLVLALLLITLLVASYRSLVKVSWNQLAFSNTNFFFCKMALAKHTIRRKFRNLFTYRVFIRCVGYCSGEKRKERTKSTCFVVNRLQI